MTRPRLIRYACRLLPGRKCRLGALDEVSHERAPRVECVSPPLSAEPHDRYCLDCRNQLWTHARLGSGLAYHVAFHPSQEEEEKEEEGVVRWAE